MRFMVIVKADKSSEAGVMPSTEMLTAMGKFNEEMVKAGVMLAGEGLHPTSKGARIKYSGKQPSVSHGPFGVTSDLPVITPEELADGAADAPLLVAGARIDRPMLFIDLDGNIDADVARFREHLRQSLGILREQEARLRAQAGKK